MATNFGTMLFSKNRGFKWNKLILYANWLFLETSLNWISKNYFLWIKLIIINSLKLRFRYSYWKKSIKIGFKLKRKA